MEYESFKVVESAIESGVSYTVSRMSFARRLELMRQVRELARKSEFLASGQDAAGKMDSALLQAEIDRLYLTWGLREVHGLTLDGHPATPETLAVAGPEKLFREALSAVRGETGLSEAERKN
jgi:hypothetical protein